MRGKVLQHDFGLVSYGITPAYAGKRAAPAGRGCRPWDHPRVCGEKMILTLSTQKDEGSPPRMRGKADPPSAHLRQAGITPAYAGKSAMGTHRLRSAGDHPRVCGEKTARSTHWPQPTGSPPRMRGKVGFQNLKASPVGITPAYAGKSIASIHSLLPNLGSPPRMRGKGNRTEVLFHKIRITPAYAGKSVGKNRGSSRPKDHPRVCGEKLMHRGPVLVPLGSPPRMRGKGKERMSYGKS